MPSVPQDRKRKASKPAQDKYAPTTWGKADVGLEDLVVPSGQTCLVRRPGVQGLIEAGVLRDIDSLTAIVDQKHIKRVNNEPEIDTESLMEDMPAILSILTVVDKIICYCVVKPEVLIPPVDPTEREAGVVYADMVDLDDKMFIFNFAVGGTRSLDTFRGELVNAVGGVDPLQDDAGDAE